jgi:multiple RNA-binding domain-containing protein 1
MNAESNNRQIRELFDQANSKDQTKEEKEKVEEEAEGSQVKEAKPVEEAADDGIEQTRLFVMNLSYKVTHDELRDHFEKFGPVEHIEIPLRKGGKGQAAGFAYVSFKETEAAISAFAQNDKTYFQGRKIHIFPSQRKPPQEPKEDWKAEPREKREEEQKPAAVKSGEFKSEKEKTLKLNFDDETNWNYLFVNQDTVATSMAKKLGMQKSDLFGQDSTNIAVKMA